MNCSLKWSLKQLKHIFQMKLNISNLFFVSSESIESWKLFSVETFVAAELSLIVGQVTLLVHFEDKKMRKLSVAFTTAVNQLPVVGVNDGHVTPKRRVVKTLFTDLQKIKLQTLLQLLIIICKNAFYRSAKKYNCKWTTLTIHNWLTIWKVTILTKLWAL